MEAQRAIRDLIDTMDSTWRVQEVVWRDGVTSWMGLLMAEIRRENQLRLVVFPIIFRVLYIPGGSPDFSHQQDDWILMMYRHET